MNELAAIKADFETPTTTKERGRRRTFVSSITAHKI